MNRRNTILDTEVSKERIGGNISWASIFAGAVTFVAMMFLLSFIGAGIGFGNLDFQAKNPIDGVFAGVGIWTVIQLVISLFAGGFVAGLAAKRVGLLHGFLSWALSLVLVVVTVVSLISSAVSTTANIAGSVAGTAGKAASSVVGSLGDGLNSLGDTISQEISKQGVEVDTKELQANIDKYLKDTDNEKLKPSYLQSQLDNSVKDIQQAAKDIALNPGDAEKITNNVVNNIEERATKISESVNKEDVRTAVAKNTDLSEAEVKEISENIYNGLQKATENTQKMLKESSAKLQKLVKDTKANINETVDKAKDVANNVASKTSGASILVFVGLLLGAALSMAGGVLGSRVSEEKFVEEN